MTFSIKLRPVLPLELYRNIIGWVADIEDLYNLCLTSQLCYREARRVLYRSVDIGPDVERQVLWASTILQYSSTADIIRELTLRFDLSLLVIPDMLSSSLLSMAQALGALRKLEKLVLVGHPRVMMHPLHTWILDKCTTELRTFHNSVFPASAIIPFLSRCKNIQEWKQTGVYHGKVIGHNVLPQLKILDAHASLLSCFVAPRPLVRVRLKIDDWWGTKGTRTREAIATLAQSGNTITTLIIKDVSTTSNYLELSQLLPLLLQVTPNLKVLAYAANISPTLNIRCLEQLRKFPSLAILVLELRRSQLCTDKDRCIIPKQTFFRCPSLHCVAVKDQEVYCYYRRQESNVASENVVEMLNELVPEDPR